MSYLLAVVTSAAVDVCRKIGLHGYFQFFGQMRQRGLARSRDDCVSLTEELTARLPSMVVAPLLSGLFGQALVCRGGSPSCHRGSFQGIRSSMCCLKMPLLVSTQPPPMPRLLLIPSTAEPAHPRGTWSSVGASPESLRINATAWREMVLRIVAVLDLL